MTPKQIEQFNRMRNALRKISMQYQSADQLRKNSEKQYGLRADDAIEYAYENVRNEARSAVAGVKAIDSEREK